MIALTLFALAAISAICAFGIFSHAYKDNMWQRLGMIFAHFGCLSTMVVIGQLDQVHPGVVTTIFGVLFYAIGTAIKTYRYSKKEPSYDSIFH